MGRNHSIYRTAGSAALDVNSNAQQASIISFDRAYDEFGTRFEAVEVVQPNLSVRDAILSDALLGAVARREYHKVRNTKADTRFAFVAFGAFALVAALLMIL